MGGGGGGGTCISKRWDAHCLAKGCKFQILVSFRMLWSKHRHMYIKIYMSGCMKIVLKDCTQNLDFNERLGLL